MTNITLSIEDGVYHEMKKHSEIKWSEFVRKAIKQRLEILKKIEGTGMEDSVMAMLASEDTLKKDWDNKADERWNQV